MTEEQIKQIEEKLETLRTMIKKAASNGNHPSVNRTKSELPLAKAKGFVD